MSAVTLPPLPAAVPPTPPGAPPPGPWAGAPGSFAKALQQADGKSKAAAGDGADGAEPVTVRRTGAGPQEPDDAEPGAVALTEGRAPPPPPEVPPDAAKALGWLAAAAAVDALDAAATAGGSDPAAIDATASPAADPAAMRATIDDAQAPLLGRRMPAAASATGIADGLGGGDAGPAPPLHAAQGHRAGPAGDAPTAAALPGWAPAPGTAAPPAAAALPDAARLAPPLHSPAFAPALGAQLSLMVRDGLTEARLHLNPAEMGPLSVRISIDGHSARVDLVADHLQTRQVLEQAMPVLAATLRDSGLTLTGGGVFEQPRDARQPAADGQRGSAAPGAGNGNGEDGVAGQGVAGDPLRAAGRARGVVDLYA